MWREAEAGHGQGLEGEGPGKGVHRSLPTSQPPLPSSDSQVEHVTPPATRIGSG